MPLSLFKQVERAVHAAQHAEAEDIHVHEFESVDIIFVLFDDLTILHGRAG